MYCVIYFMSKLEEFEKELFNDNLHHIDKLGRKYHITSGPKHLELKFSDDTKLKKMAIDILKIIKKDKHLTFIEKGYIAFAKSTGRKETNRNEIYIHGIRTVLQSFFKKDICYIIEVTADFYKLIKKEQIKLLLRILMRIPTNQEKPNGQFIRFDSFENQQQDFNLIIDSLNIK